MQGLKPRKSQCPKSTQRADLSVLVGDQGWCKNPDHAPGVECLSKVDCHSVHYTAILKAPHRVPKFVTNITLTGSAMVNWDRDFLSRG